MSLTPLEQKKTEVADMLNGIERYNPNNCQALEDYVDMQCREHGYDLEANLALLKLYQFNPGKYRLEMVVKIMLKALTNLPHSDYVCCKALLTQENLEEALIKNIQYLADLLEMCQFKAFWTKVHGMGELVRCVAGFENLIRKFVCHVISITYQNIQEETLCELLGLVDENTVNQWIEKNGWKSNGGFVLISNQEESIKTKQIRENIDLESVAGIMAASY